MSLSTFCRSCGKHFKIDKSRSVVSQTHKDLEKISRDVSGDPPPTPAEAAQPDQASGKVTSSIPMVQVSELPYRPSANETQSFRMARAVRSNSSGSFANRHKPRPVACFHCDGVIEVSYAAKSAECPVCNEAINLNDYEINKPLYEDIFTRGNVTINKLGSLECESLVCHNLKAYGEINTLVHATGDVMIRTRATLPNGLRCKKLLVGRDAHVEVGGDVYAEEMEVDGVITADAFNCVGTTRIDGHGAINGPLKTRSVAMENGGALNGALQIVATKPQAAG
ncbi:MAG: hypothetical protein ACI8T1_001719 [Verrucomicrobiales bacterium]|jgi:hypothetical protein